MSTPRAHHGIPFVESLYSDVVSFGVLLPGPPFNTLESERPVARWMLGAWSSTTLCCAFPEPGHLEQHAKAGPILGLEQTEDAHCIEVLVLDCRDLFCCSCCIIRS